MRQAVLFFRRLAHRIPQEASATLPLRAFNQAAAPFWVQIEFGRRLIRPCTRPPPRKKKRCERGFRQHTDIGLACSKKLSPHIYRDKSCCFFLFAGVQSARRLNDAWKIISRRLILFVRRARGAGRGLAPIDAANGAAASHVKISARSPRGESPFPLFLWRCALTPGCISNLRKLLLTIRIHKGLPLSTRFLPSAPSLASTAENPKEILHTTLLLLYFVDMEIDRSGTFSSDIRGIVVEKRLNSSMMKTKGGGNKKGKRQK